MTASLSSEKNTTERLFDTAAELFCREGFAATTTREIAAAVGIQQASLYHHMASKEELLYRICLFSLEQFLTDVPAAVDRAGASADRISVLVRSHLATLFRYQQRNSAMLLEMRSLTARHRSEVLGLRDRYERYVRSLLEQAQAEGLLRADVPAKYLGVALMSILNYTAVWFRTDKELSEEQLAEMLTKVFAEGAGIFLEHPLVTLPDFSKQGKKPPARARKAVSDSPAVARAVNAAVALFSRKGYAATSTREVAKLLGIQKASLYYHVESKEDLLFLICQFSLTQIRIDVENAIRDCRDPLSRTWKMICAHVQSFLRDEPQHTTNFAEMHSLSPDRFAEVLKLRDLYEDLVRQVLRDAQAAGVVRNDIEVKYLCLALLSLINRVIVWYRRKGPLSPDQIGQMLAVLFLTGAQAHAVR